MMDFGSMIGAIEKLNEYNYRGWRTCIKFYLKSLDLWEIVDGNDTTPPDENDKSYNSWLVKASKVMHIFMCTIDNGLRTQIEDAETPKEIWDTLALLFSKRNSTQLLILEEELNYQTTCATEDDVDEEEWDLSGQNGELWIKDMETDDNPEILRNSMIMETISDQLEDDVSIKKEDERHAAVIKDTSGFVLNNEDKELEVTQLGIQDWLVEAGAIKYKDTTEEFTWQRVGKQGEPSENQLKLRKRLPSKRPPDQFKHAKFDIGANITRPPEGRSN